MKIVIDVGVIGLAQLYETARTGIYRVITSLTLELLARPELDIAFTSLSSLQVNQLTDRYLADKGFGDRAFERNRYEQLLISLGGGDPRSAREKLQAKICSRLYRMSLTPRIGRQTDLFHSQYAPLPSFGRGRRAVRLLTIYDIIPLIHPEYFADGFADEFKRITESFSPQDDFIFTISECSKRDICTYFGMDRERVFVTTLAASPEQYHPVRDMKLVAAVRKRFQIPEGRYFLTLATVEKRKNLETSIACFRKILQEPGCGDLSFVLVGTRGWKVGEIIEEIERDSLLRNRVIFTGFVPDEYLSALYSGAEAFLYPSLYEGFGLPPLEAMQCGLPVIVSNTSSLPEVVGDAGILVDPLDQDGICGAMLQILQDKDVRMQYVARGLARSEEFSWNRCAEQTIAGYGTAWGGREHSPRMVPG